MKLQQQLVQTQDFPLAVSSNLVTQEFKDEVLIYNLETNQAFCLNETSGAVWQACDGNRSVAEISQLVSKDLNSFVSEEIVWLALEQLKRDNLLINSEDFVINFNGLSRREMIKKAGLATMVAFPLVTSLIAPATASAASPGAACTTPLSIINVLALANLTVGGVGQFLCNSNSDCCPLSGCLPITANVCAAVTIGNPITGIPPLADVNICVGVGVCL